ncbi:MAG TPA: PKD domain-containing protein, partial [Flavisolibacter sp.]
MRKALSLALLSLLPALLCFGQAPSANFSASVTSGCVPMVVNFTDQSTGSPTSWFWDFGNGATSTLKNPSTSYMTPGTYTVTLTVSNASGSSTVTRPALINIFPKPTVSFSVDDNAGCYPHPVQFTDLSTAGGGTVNTSWSWDFGNGQQSSQQHPQANYTTSGNFTVTLKVTNDKGCYTVVPRPNFINISPGVDAEISHTTPARCRPPYPVSFNAITSGPGTLTHTWDFGDGTTSNQVNPTHTYSSPGNYTVVLTTSSSAGCTDTRVKQLQFEDISTSFTAPDSICVNEAITLQNSSTPAPASTSWNFGDGSAGNGNAVSKTFTTPGIYTIRMTSSFSACTDSADRVIRVLPRPAVAFTADETVSCKPGLTVNFTDQTPGATGWQWDFGDGATSTQQHPVHIYNAYGDFEVMLVVTNASGCSDTLRKPAFIRIRKAVISIPALPDKGCIPFTIQPVASIQALDQVTSYQWHFGEGTTSTLQQPSHTYTVQGTYDVSLVITTSTGCTDTFTVNQAVKVGRIPVVDFSVAPPEACASESFQFTDLTNEADEWGWHFNDGTTSTQQNPSHVFSYPGTFDVKLIATNNGCSDSATKTNIVLVKPPLARFGFTTDCNNRLQFNFADQSIGALTWSWDFGDGTTSTQQNPVH